MTAALIAALIVFAGLVLGALQGRKNHQEPALLRFQAWQLFLGVVLLVVLAGHSRLGLTLPSVSAHDLSLPHVTLPHVNLSGSAVKAGLVVLALLLAVVALLRRRRAATA